LLQFAEYLSCCQSPKRRNGHGLSKVEVLWQLSNYFKHRDEWDSVAWDGGNRFTLDAITAARSCLSRRENPRPEPEQPRWAQKHPLVLCLRVVIFQEHVSSAHAALQSQAVFEG